jgi:prevent-host-death family protein
MEMNIADARDNLADVINRVAYAGERVVLRRRSKRVVAIVSMEDLELLQAAEDRADLKAALRARKEKGGVTLAQYRKKHGL